MATASGKGSNLDGVRQHNLAIVLQLVHRAGRLSRSELTRETGLNRSTVGALVAELAALQLVSESEPDATNGVGRPSSVVRASSSIVAITVNPEVDAVSVGVVGLDGTVHQRVRHRTPQPPTARETADIVAAVIDGLGDLSQSGLQPVAIGAAVPGLVREADGVVRLAPHLDWVDEPLAALLTEACGLPAQVANDANRGADAEHLYGAGRGVDDLLYLNGGAGGIGGGVIANGIPLGGTSGYAGELGHTLVNSAGQRCHCGSTGCLETEVAQAPLLKLLGIETDGGALDAALAATSDPLVRSEVRRQLGFLAITLSNAVNAFNPRVIALGGFLASLHAAMPDVLEGLVKGRVLSASAEHLSITRAVLGSDLLTIGAAELAFGPLLADPSSIHIP